MELKDLQLYSDEHSDRVLIIGDSAGSAAGIGALLERRGYTWTHAASLSQAAELSAAQLYDLIILDQQESTASPEELLARVMAERDLARSGVLLIHPQAELYSAGAGWLSGTRVQVLSAPVEPSALLVKVATQLRLRKLRSDQVGFEARLAEENAELRDLTNRFKHELREAKAIHDSLLPKHLPKAQGALFSAYCMPYEAVGGDLYDVWKLDDDLYGLFIADVTGHGLSAAFVGAMTKMALAYADKSTPGTMFADMNTGLHRYMIEGRFVTAAAAFYRTSTGKLSVARAGHPPPLLWRSEKGAVERLMPRGLPLGIVANEQYELFETHLAPGDKLLLVTDGLTEAADMEGSVFGLDGLVRCFQGCAPNERIVNCIGHVLEEQRRFSGDRVLRDDLTIVGMERYK